MSIIYRIVLILFIFPAVVFSAPSISGVSGTVSNGESITISGSDFGANGPTVHLFDDFELGTNDAELLTGANSAQVGQWDAVDDSVTTPLFSNDYSVSTDLTYSSTNVHYSSGLTTNFPGLGVTKIFASYWAYIPTGYTIPDNWKIVWFQGDDHSDDDVVVTTLLGGSGGLMNGNDSSWSEASNIGFSIASWKRVSCYFEGTVTATGVVQMDVLDPSVTRTIDVSDAYIFVDDSTPDDNHYFERMLLNSYFGSGDSGTPCYMDDVYVATGDYARARIEIGNNSTYANCTNLAVVTPTSWADGSITGVVRQGSFPDGAAFLFVFDSAGDPSAGEPITIGSAAEQSTSIGTGTSSTFSAGDSTVIN